MSFKYPNRLRRIPLLLRDWSRTAYFLNRSLWFAGMPWTSIPPEPLPAIFPGIEQCEATIVNPFPRTWGISLELDELVALMAIARFVHASKVLEIGTFDGNTALNFAANGASVVTVDLPPEGVTGSLLKPGERLNATAPEVCGRQFHGHPLAAGIRQIYGDSATIPWDRLGGPFDPIFIDGCHTSAYVHSDSVNARKCIRQGGVIVWHDYTYPEVASVLDAFAAGAQKIRVIAGTRLAISLAEPGAARPSRTDLAFANQPAAEPSVSMQARSSGIPDL